MLNPFKQAIARRPCMEMPEGYPETKAGILDNGYQVVELDVSEFRKMDGGLSCLSLRF